MLKIKGIAIKSTINYIKSKLKPEELSNFENILSIEAKNLFISSILSSDWYEVNFFVEIMSRVPEIVKRDSYQVWWEMGRFSCEDGLSTVYKLFYKFGSPEFIIKRAAQVWSNYYSEGIFFVVSHSFNYAHVQIKDISFPHPALCIRISGWMERAIELSGGKNVILRHTLCKFQKQIIEEWKASWT